MAKRNDEVILCVIGAFLIIFSSLLVTPIQEDIQVAQESRFFTQEDDEDRCTGPICITEINLQCPPVILFGSCEYYVLDNYPQGNTTQVNFPWGPWIELHNSGSEAIDISDYYFDFIFADDEVREGNASIPICLDCDSDGDGVPGPGTLIPYLNDHSSTDNHFIVQPDSYAVIRALYTCISVECGDFQGNSIYPTNVVGDSDFFRKNIQLHDSSGDVIQTILLHEAPSGKATVGGTSSPRYNYQLQISHSSLVYNHTCSISDSYGDREGECFERVRTSYGYSSGSGSWEKFETPITPWGGLYYWTWHYPDDYLNTDNYTDQDGNSIPCPECGSWTTDMDVDGVADEADNCPIDANGNQIDIDSDGIGDICDDDRDGDGTENEFDPFPDDGGESADSDNDGVGDNSDQCNGYDDSIDFDQDGIIDGCDSFVDSDDDDDGVFSTFDLCPGTSALSIVDNDGCSDMQLDTDGDGVVDGLDVCSNGDDQKDEDLDGKPDDCDDIIDTDRDGVADIDDQCEGYPDTDLDNDGIPDACDNFIDLDNDGVPDEIDLCPGSDDSIDLDSDGVPDGCDNIVDSDFDGVSDDWDRCEGHDDYIDDDWDGVPDDCDSFIMSRTTQNHAFWNLVASIAGIFVYVSIFSRKLESNRGGSHPASTLEGESISSFESLDTDGDGVLSKEEFEAAEGIEDGEFERLDADGDGELTKEEFEEFDDF